MKMSEVRVGMRLRDPHNKHFPLLTVTELTPRGFKYSLDRPYSLIPRWGMSYAKDGHEHYGDGGECYFELVQLTPEAPDR